MKCKRLCAWLLCLVMMFSLLPVSAAAADSSATTPVYVFFQTINTNGKPVEVKKGVTYNVNGNSWATLGKLVTTTDVTTETPLGGEVFDGNSSFTRHSSNSGLDLKLIRGWDKPKQASGAPGYDEEEGKMTWHLDGTVYGYRAIYCDSDRNELANFDPNQAPEYYLEGTANIGVSTKEPATVPDGKVFDCWVTNDVTVADDNTFTMPHNNVIFTPKWKTGTLVIQKVLETNSPATENTFSFTVTPEGSTSGTGTRITGAAAKRSLICSSATTPSQKIPAQLL